MDKSNMIGLVGFATLLTSIPVSANELPSHLAERPPLPVITNDCGASDCGDRRKLELAQFSQRLSDASAQDNGVVQNSASQGQQKKNNGQGLAIGQGNNDTQVVYLNFEQSSPTFPAVVSGTTPWLFLSHQYTETERDAIQANLEADYQGFDITFTQTLPTEGEFSTLNFECQTANNICVNFSSGILFGRAQSIDIGNQVRDDSAFVDVGLWEVFAQLDPSGGLLEAYSGIEIENGDVAAALSKAIINQASNTGAHELGHNLGLRHHDSFGSPGTGIPTTGVPSNDAFFPVFDGLQNGDEAILHTMASGASVGSGLTDSTARDRFFSERSVIKLAAAERGRLISEASVAGKKVTLRKVVAPNTLLEGDNAEGKLDIREALIRGAISTPNEVDEYRFKAKAGEFISAEFNGFDVPVGSPVIGAVELYFIDANGEQQLVAQNYQNFEGFDAFLIDAPLAQSGEYVLKVSSPNFVSFGYNPDGSPILFPLEETGNGALRVGDYQLSMYIVDGKPGNGPSQVPGQ